MADSDCSNCDNVCQYKYVSYNCMVNEIKEIKTNFNEDEINKIKEVVKILRSKEDDMDICINISDMEDLCYNFYYCLVEPKKQNGK